MILLIGEITKVWITPTHIIVADRFQAQAIFIFDRQGEFQAVIDNLGRGPTEYLKISDVVLTPDKKRIAILDSYKMVLLYYDLRGTFLYKKKIPFLSSDIEYIDDENIVMLAYGMQPKDPGLANYDHKEDYVYLLDSTLYIKASAMHIPASIKKFEDRVYITPAWSDSIYRMTSDGRLSLRYRIDMTENPRESEFRTRIARESDGNFSYKQYLFQSLCRWERFRIVHGLHSPDGFQTSSFLKKDG